VKCVSIEPYFRSCLTEGSRAVVSLLKPHTSWTPDELCEKRAAAYIALTAKKWILGYSLSRFPSVSNCRCKSSTRQLKYSPPLYTNFYWAYKNSVPSSRNMGRTFDLEVPFLTTYCLVFHQPVYDILFGINYRSSYSFFLLHLALVLSPQFLSRFALTSHSNILFLIYAQFFSV